MNPKIKTGLEILKEHPEHPFLQGNVGLLCNSASVDNNYDCSIIPLKKICNLKRVFGPQHGFGSTVQDNMIETEDSHDPYFDLPIYSLYSSVRRPKPEQLDSLDTVIVDLQDVGTRVYTYIWTMSLLMEQCKEQGVKVLVLDRPNPVGGEIIEGNITTKDYRSFVSRYDIPMRHGMTIGEIALYLKKYHEETACELDVIRMQGWSRKMFWSDTGLDWVNTSPNLGTVNSVLVYPGTVIFEGTELSEGRGTTRSLEMIGHPKIQNAYELCDRVRASFEECGIKGVAVRAVYFEPTFQKHANVQCGGVHLHATDPKEFKSWRASQILLREFASYLGADFEWNHSPYEYEFEGKAIDYINGGTELSSWVERNGTLEELEQIELAGREAFLAQRESILLYHH